MAEGLVTYLDLVNRSAYKAGSGWITAMAEGTVSIDQINRMHDKRIEALERDTDEERDDLC